MSSLIEKSKEDQNNDEDSDDNKSDTDVQCNITTIDLKITIVGNSGVGKTSIIHKFIDRDFDERITATISAASAFVKSAKFVTHVSFCSSRSNALNKVLALVIWVSLFSSNGSDIESIATITSLTLDVLWVL